MKKLIISTCIILILLTTLTLALEASAGPARITLIANQGELKTGRIRLFNSNNQTVNVTIMTEGTISPLISFNRTEHLLEPEEERYVNYEVVSDEVGFYSGKLPIMFKYLDWEGGIIAAITMVINVKEANPFDTKDPFVTPNPKNTNDDNKTAKLLAIFLPISAIIITMLIVLIINKKNNL